MKIPTKRKELLSVLENMIGILSDEEIGQISVIVLQAINRESLMGNLVFVDNESPTANK